MKPNKADLRFARNMFGTLLSVTTDRINAYMECPCYPHWDDIYGIILNPNGKMLTVWQAVLEIDPTFPRVGRLQDQHGKVLEDWGRIPTVDQLHEAIYYATH